MECLLYNKDKSAWACDGTVFYCDYNNYEIIIYPSKNIQEESKNDSIE